MKAAHTTPLHHQPKSEHRLVQPAERDQCTMDLLEGENHIGTLRMFAIHLLSYRNLKDQKSKTNLVLCSNPLLNTSIRTSPNIKLPLIKLMQLQLYRFVGQSL